jgi:hypothetical protein
MASKEAESSSRTPEELQERQRCTADIIPLAGAEDSNVNYNDSLHNKNRQVDCIDLCLGELGKRFEEGVEPSRFPTRPDVDASLIVRCMEDCEPSGYSKDSLERELSECYIAGVVEDSNRRRMKILQLLLALKRFIMMTPNDRMEYLKLPRDLKDDYTMEFGRWDWKGEIHQEAEGTKDKRVLVGRIFPYSQLDRDALEIRLLELLPGTQNDLIECKLLTTTLHDHQRFEALSYTWGKSQDPQMSVAVDGIQLPVSQNLFDALLHLRNNNKSRTLWIDAICINQTDVQEKTHQVQLMAKIFSSANRVLVWLGPEENDSGFVMNLLQQVSEGHIDSEDEVFESDRIWRSIKSFMDRDWWSRIWVVQEVAMATDDPLLYCGFSSVPWTLLQPTLRKHCPKFAGALTERLEDAAENLNKLIHWSRFSAIRNRRTDRVYQAYDFLKSSQNHNATDPRDMIFALFGFFDSRHQSVLTPDYTLTIEFVFTLATTVVVLLDDNLDLFHTYSIAQNASFPSWVPDFAFQKRGSPYDPRSCSTEPHKIHMQQGDRPSASHNLPPLLTAFQFGQLGVEGFQFDSVVEVYDFGNLEENPEPFYERIRLLEVIAKQSQRKEVDPTSSTFLFSHLRSKEPVNNLFRGGMPLDLEDLQEYETNLDSLIDLQKIQQEDPHVILEGYDGLKIYEVVQKHRQALEKSRTYFLLYPVLGRKLFITSLGFTGIGVPTVQKGDLVTILFGFRLPFVIRDHGKYQTFVGGSRVGGVMEGELIPFYEEGLFQRRSFVIH